MLSSHIVSTKRHNRPQLLATAGAVLFTISTAAFAQSFFVQCPTKTLLHPTAQTTEPAYNGPHSENAYPNGVPLVYVSNGGAIKCQQISGGDGYMTEADGNQTFMFSFGPLSGINSIEHGQPGTQFPNVFNLPYCNGPSYNNGQPNPYWTGSACKAGTSPDGAVGIAVGPSFNVVAPGLAPNIGVPQGTDAAAIMSTGVMNGNLPAPLAAFDEDDEFFLTLTNVGMIMRPDLFEQHTVHFHGYPNASSFYDGVPDASLAINIGGSFTYYYLAPDAGTYFWHCHVTPPEHLQMGMVGQLYVRPRQNRVSAGTSLYSSMQLQQTDLRTACHVANDILCSTPMPATNNNAMQPVGSGKYAYNDGDGTTFYDIDVPIQIHGFDPNFHFVGMTFNPEGFADMKDKYFLLNGRSYPDTVSVTTGAPAGWTGGLSAASLTAATETNPDGSTSTNPRASNAISTMSSDGFSRPSQPLPSLIVLKQGQRALLRISDLDVTEYQTLASQGLPMTVVGFNAKLLRDQAGNNLYIRTNSITLGGGESLDAILDTCTSRASTPPFGCNTGALVPTGTYFLYTPNLDHLSNDAENFGGLMTEVVVTN
jgi:FtsP/CotA-like multicopper oxidase with cupredoxin domain